MIKRINKIKNFGVFKYCQIDKSTSNINKYSSLYGLKI